MSRRSEGVVRSRWVRWASGLAVLVAALGVLAGYAQVRGHGDEARAVVATVAGYEITAEDFRDAYGTYLLKTGQQDRRALRADYLDYLVGRRLAVQAMRDAGIAREDGYRFEAAAVRQKLLLDAYAEYVLFDTLEVTEADLRELFGRINTRLKARHLYARTEAEAAALYARLQQGASFEALAAEIFADSLLAARGGSVGYFGFDEMDPAFEAAAYDLAVGEVSPPVRTALGYSIIQLEDRQVTPVMTEAAFAEKRDQLRRYALRRKRTEALARHSRMLEAALGLTFHTPALTRLMAQIEGTALAPDGDAALGDAAAAWLAEPLVTFGPEKRRQTWRVADFRERAQYTTPEQRAQIRTEAQLRTFIAGLAVREVMMEGARVAGLDEEPRYAAALAAAMDDWVYAEARRRQAEGVTVPEDSLRAYYEANRSLFTAPEQVQVREILVDRKAEADRLRGLLASTPFDVLARRHSTRPGADATGGDLGFVGRAQLGRLADPVFAAAEGDVLGPLEVAGRYVLLQVGARRAPRAVAYAEARDDVVAVLRDRYVEDDFRAYVDTLRARYDVRIDEAALMRLALAP